MIVPRPPFQDLLALMCGPSECEFIWTIWNNPDLYILSLSGGTVWENTNVWIMSSVNDISMMWHLMLKNTSSFTQTQQWQCLLTGDTQRFNNFNTKIDIEAISAVCFALYPASYTVHPGDTPQLNQLEYFQWVKTRLTLTSSCGVLHVWNSGKWPDSSEIVWIIISYEKTA